MAGSQLQSRLLGDGHERRDVPDDRPRHQLGRHVLYGRRDLRPRASSQPGRVRRPVSPGCRSTAGWRSAFSSPAWACRACAVSSAKCWSRFRVWNFSHALAMISAVDGDPHGRLHPVDHSARVPGARIQRPARRSFESDHAARDCHRRAAVGVGDLVRRVIRKRLFNYMTPTINSKRKLWPPGRKTLEIRHQAGMASGNDLNPASAQPCNFQRLAAQMFDPALRQRPLEN